MRTNSSTGDFQDLPDKWLEGEGYGDGAAGHGTGEGTGHGVAEQDGYYGDGGLDPQDGDWV